MTYVPTKSFRVLQWRWPARFAERLMLALTFLLHFFCQEKKWKEEFNIFHYNAGMSEPNPKPEPKKKAAKKK